METRVLKYFLKIAELGNVTKAAQELHITQPTLSRQLHELERELGTPLFSRENKKMTLTSAGIIYQQEISKVLAELESINQSITDSDELTGTVNIGCGESSADQLMSQLIMDFHQQYPEVKFNVYTGDGDDVKEKLDRGLLDFGFVLWPVEIAKYNYRYLKITDEWGLVAPKGSAVAEKTTISISELKTLPLIIPRRRIIQDNFSDLLGIPESSLQIVAYHNLLSNVLELVRKQVGYVVCAKWSYQNRPEDDLKFIPIQYMKPIEQSIIWSKNRSFSSSVTRFLEFLKEQDIYVD